MAEHAPEAVIADKGYDKKGLVNEIESRGAEAVIPTQKERKKPRDIDRHLYRERAVHERFWSKVKQYRRIAARYEKKAANFVAFVKVAAIVVTLKQPGHHRQPRLAPIRTNNHIINIIFNIIVVQFTPQPTRRGRTRSIRHRCPDEALRPRPC